MSERVSYEGTSWLDLISGHHISKWACLVALWTLEIRIMNWREGRSPNREKLKLRQKGFHLILFIWLYGGGNPERRWRLWRTCTHCVENLEANSWELTCINSPSLSLFLKEAKTVHSDNSYCWTLEPSWSIACGISITALTTGGEKEREKMAREWWWFGRTKSSTQIYFLPLALHYNVWVASGIRGQNVIGIEGLWNEDKESKVDNNGFLKAD